MSLFRFIYLYISISLSVSVCVSISLYWSLPHSLSLSLSPSLPLSMLWLSLFLSSVCGNGAVLAVYYRKRRKIKPAELLTVNLALCDLGFSVLGAPFFIVSSWSHAWMFGETGCLLYGIQGSVFGIGSLITTCLISLDRCLKICCLRYGNYGNFGLSLVLVCIRTPRSDRVYVYLFLCFGFGLPTITIIASYLGILIKVYTSSRALASIPCCAVSNGSTKDLKLMAAAVCAAFLVAWLPYASVSLISALLSGEEDPLSKPTPAPVALSSALNWTTADSSKHTSHPPGPSTTGPESSLPPMVTVIPAMFAKSHCMMNPVIYQIMHREFRDSLYELVFGRQKADRRRQRRKTASVHTSVSMSVQKREPDRL
uniref:G-protein coupled receptors family 1 profile domain-containing protein n=1 Tax=Periophthalmus magnuspinnatus TaxID=409849 RepID=A0A3B4A410_9GOBI